MERASVLLAGLKAQGSSNFAVFSGDDLTAIFLMLMGGHGNISVTANVAPNLMSKLCEAAVLGQLETAREIQFQLLSLHQLMFIEPNPIPVKWALHEMGMIAPGIRLPLTPLSQSIQATLVKNLAKLGFVK